jgi:hypothetical protein
MTTSSLEENVMTDPTLDDLTTRLERLERQGRRWKRAAFVVLLGAAAVVVMGQAPPHRLPKSLEAEEFVLRDSRGQVRASLGTAQGSNSTVLQFHGENGKPRTRITVASDGTSSLEVMDTGDHVRLLLGVRDNGVPRIWLGNETGKIIWRAP